MAKCSKSVPSTPKDVSAFDLITTGVGYLNRVRTISPKSGATVKFKPFLACSISAIHGTGENMQYTYFDCRVCGKIAIDIVNMLMEIEKDDDSKIIIGFSIGDAMPTSFLNKKGEAMHQIKGRLLKISSVKINGEKVDLSAFYPPVDESDTVIEGARNHPQGGHGGNLMDDEYMQGEYLDSEYLPAENGEYLPAEIAA